MVKKPNKTWVFVSVIVIGVILVMVFNKYSNETYRTYTTIPPMNDFPGLCRSNRSKLQRINLRRANLDKNEEIVRKNIDKFCTRGEVNDTYPTMGRYFDPFAYANRYSDLRKAFGYNTDALTNHWVSTGILEQRNGARSGSCGKFNPAVYARINGLKNMDYSGIMNHYRNVGVPGKLNYC